MKPTRANAPPGRRCNQPQQKSACVFNRFGREATHAAQPQRPIAPAEGRVNDVAIIATAGFRGERVHGPRISRFDVRPSGGPVVRFIDSRDVTIEESRASEGAEVFLELRGKRTAKFRPRYHVDTLAAKRGSRLLRMSPRMLSRVDFLDADFAEPYHCVFFHVLRFVFDFRPTSG